MNDQVIKNVIELNDKRNKNQILSECVKELKINKNSVWQLLLSVIISFILSVYIAFYANTVAVTRSIISIFLDVELAFFAVILGAYAIFQALMRDEIIKELIKTENNILKESNSTFLNLSLLYVLDIFVTVIISIVVNICTEEVYIYSIFVSNILFTMAFFMYCTLNFLLLLENINFIINLYRMFNVYNIYRALETSDDK